jgi:hypothetical protein
MSLQMRGQIKTGPAFWWLDGAIALHVSSENCRVHSHIHGYPIAKFIALRNNSLGPGTT